jgi:hypothetical protein
VRVRRASGGKRSRPHAGSAARQERAPADRTGICGATGDWFIDRTTRFLPFCNYYNEIGIYSMRSYTLAPQLKTERIEICRSGARVPPYAGKCPP